MKAGICCWGGPPTGNGAMAHDIARIAPYVTKWLAVKHPSLREHKPYLDAAEPHCEIIKCDREGQKGTYRSFLKGLDVLIWIEQPYLRGFDIIAECKKMGILTVGIPMYEWMPNDVHWLNQTDMLWCVTPFTRRYCAGRSQLMNECHWKNRIFGDRWGVDLNEFQFSERRICNRVLFANGNGGVGGRKGCETVFEAATLIPDIPITVFTQGSNHPKQVPANVTMEKKNFTHRHEIYEHGDIFLAPSYWEGLGHQLYEAQACGLPVLATDAAPMNECGTPLLVPLQRAEPHAISGKLIQKTVPDAATMAGMIRTLHESNIADLSNLARGRIEAHHGLADVLDDLGEALRGCM